MATISSLRKALETAGSSFRTLYDIVWEQSPILRSKYFAESRILLAGRPTLLMMPLTSTALQHIEALLPHKLHIGSDIVPKIGVLRDEIYFTDPTGAIRTADIMLEPLPDGVPLKEALSAAEYDPASAEALIAAVDTLQEQLMRADLSHNNLKEENLVFDSHNRLRPTHWYYATKGVGGDNVALESLRTKIASLGCKGELHEPNAPAYGFEICDLAPYRNTLPFAEGLIGVETEDGWGFIDCDGEIVIRPQYRWVSKFTESRAEVESDSGMGLIDRSGRYIIPPCYCIVDYDPVTGHSMVNDGSAWAEFDYSGNIVKEFGAVKPKI